MNITVYSSHTTHACLVFKQSGSLYHCTTGSKNWLLPRGGGTPVVLTTGLFGQSADGCVEQVGYWHPLNVLQRQQTKAISITLHRRHVRTVQFNVVSVRLEKPICAPPRLSEVSPTLPLKRFQCSSDWRWPWLMDDEVSRR